MQTTVGFELGKVAGRIIKRFPFVYDGDGGDGKIDFIKYSIHRAMPTITRGIGWLFEPAPPKRTNLRFKYASVQDIMANFNNSILSNCPIRDFNRGMCTVNSTYSDVQVFEDKLVDAVVVVLANNKLNKLVVSYRATLTPQNGLDDLNGALVDLPGSPAGVRVHRGIYLNYLASYNNVRRTLSNLLDNPRFKNYSVLVTGYSLGGAAATIAMADLTKLVKSRQDNRQIELISYAAPRSGNPKFAEYLASFQVPVTRLTLAYDIVSHTPTRSLGYTHSGQEFHTIQPKRLGPYSIKACSQEYDEDPDCSLGESNQVTPTRHLYPFGAPIPKLPYY